MNTNCILKTGFSKSVLITIAALALMTFAGAQQPLPARQVGAGGASTIFSYFNTSPENLDGTLIAYVRCIGEPSGDTATAPAELWVCDSNLANHRKVTNIKGTIAHNGVDAQWIDNDRIIILDHKVIRLVNVRTGKDLLKKPIRADGVGHLPFQHKILYSIYTGTAVKHGIYELDCNTQQTRLVLSMEDCTKLPLPAHLGPKDIDSVSTWRALHCQYSPDGKKIAFRLDIGSSERSQVLAVYYMDGSGLKVMAKPLHFFWYDNESIVGHVQLDKNGKRPEAVEKRYSVARWDLNGNMIQEMMAPRGNHLAMSPDRQYFASESFYNTNPVVLRIYKSGQPDKFVTIASFDPYEVTWKRRFHANPAFSRDGRRVYYSKPLNGQYNGTFVCEVK